MASHPEVVEFSLPPAPDERPDDRVVYFPSDTPLSCAEVRIRVAAPARFRVILSHATFALRFRRTAPDDTTQLTWKRGTSCRATEFELLVSGSTTLAELPAGARVTELFVLVDRERAGGLEWAGDAVCRAAFEELRTPVVTGSDRMPLRETAAMTGILHALFTRTLTGAAESVFVHGCACALFALAVAELVRPRIVAGSDFRITEPDRLALADARRIILENYISPPGIHEIARTVGLNTTRLKTGFRTVYGVTVFGLVREERMKTALMLLRDRGQNVTETAYAVGYHSLSAFAAVFKKTFGFSPHEVRRNTVADGVLVNEPSESARP